MSTKTVESATEETVTLYRNFGPNELKSIQSNIESGESKIFEISEKAFGEKQFWIGEDGWEWWKKTDFAKPPNAEIIIPKSYTTPNHPNYIFRESGFDIIDGLPHFDGHPGGSVLPEKLDLFNKVIKVNWIK